MKPRAVQVKRPACSTKARRREFGRVCCVFVTCVLLSGCDEQRQQKPKVARDWSLIPNAVARFGVDAHKEAIALFERHLSEGKDVELKRYAQQTLIALKEHLSGAQKLLYAAAASR